MSAIWTSIFGKQLIKSRRTIFWEDQLKPMIHPSHMMGARTGHFFNHKEMILFNTFAKNEVTK